MTWKVGWGISNACNMSCGFCYSREVRRGSHTFSPERVLPFLSRNAAEIESINFGTGEPTLYPEFFSLCDRIKAAAPHVRLGVTTNGYLAEAVSRNAHALASFRNSIDEVDVSLDYAIPSRHDTSRETGGAFEGAMRSLQLCVANQKARTVVSVLHDGNAELENFDGLARLARINNAALRVNLYRPTHPGPHALSYQNAKRVFRHLATSLRIGSIADPLLSFLTGSPCSQGDPTGTHSLRILPNGRISPSTYLLDDFWLTRSVSEIPDIPALTEEAPFRRARARRLPPECEGCAGRDSCAGGVIDRRWLWYQDLDQRDPYCPARHGEACDWREGLANLCPGQPGLSQAHDGYLPTLIFDSRPHPATRTPWDGIYESGSKDYQGTTPERFVETLLGRCEGPVLDLGAGAGRHTLPLLLRNVAVTSVDSSRTANDLLVVRLLDAGVYGKAHIIDGDLGSAGLRRNHFALVLALHVLSHGTPEDVRAQINEDMRPLLKPGGWLAFTLPSNRDIRSQGNHCSVLSTGPEAGIPHAFFDNGDIRKLMSSFSLEYLEEVEDRASGRSHWNVIAQVPHC
jgi:radical SAM protein with 4Fe4S-binding SPASM domain